MSTEVTVALIVATPPTLAVIVSIVLMRRGNHRLHLELNSRLDDFLAIARREGVAQGRLNGASEQRARDERA